MAKLDDRKEKEIVKQINLDMSLHFNITELLNVLSSDFTALRNDYLPNLIVLFP